MRGRREGREKWRSKERQIALSKMRDGGGWRRLTMMPKQGRGKESSGVLSALDAHCALLSCVLP